MCTLKGICVVSSVWLLETSCYAHLYIFFCVNVNFYFTGVNTQQCNCWAIWRLCGYMDLFPNPQLFSPDLFVFFTSIPHYLQWCCFVLSFENRNTNPVLLFKNNLFHFLLIFLCVYMCMVCGGQRITFRGWNQTQVIRLGRKYLYQPCHLACIFYSSLRLF